MSAPAPAATTTTPTVNPNLPTKALLKCQTLEEVPFETLEKKWVGFFYGGNWCGACRGFVPILASFYNMIKPVGFFEIVYVPVEKTRQDYDIMRSKMPWLTLPYGNYAPAVKKNKVSFFPTLHIVNQKAELIGTTEQVCQSIRIADPEFAEKMALPQNETQYVKGADLLDYMIWSA